MLGFQTIHIFELVNDFTKDDLSKMKIPLEVGAKLKHCKYVTPKMTTLKNTFVFASAVDKCLRGIPRGNRQSGAINKKSR